MFWLGENAGENPEFWVREGALRPCSSASWPSLGGAVALGHFWAGGNFSILGFCLGGSGDASATLCGDPGGPESSGLVPGDDYELVSNESAMYVL